MRRGRGWMGALREGGRKKREQGRDGESRDEQPLEHGEHSSGCDPAKTIEDRRSWDAQPEKF
jgi:hypothetical protein